MEDGELIEYLKKRNALLQAELERYKGLSNALRAKLEDRNLMGPKDRPFGERTEVTPEEAAAFYGFTI